jgi:tripartite-type tricarboxylate transporter receptor subunit TctC
VIAKPDAAIRAALAKTQVNARFQALNTAVLPLTASQLDARLKVDNPRWQALMKKAGDRAAVGSLRRRRASSACASA